MADPVLRRLARLAALQRAATRSREAALARAIAEARSAAARLERIEGLLDAAGPCGPGATVPGLAAGAQLRRLLQPAADMAHARLAAAADDRATCEQALAAARARADRMIEAESLARQASGRAAEQRQADDTPPRPARPRG